MKHALCLRAFAGCLLAAAGPALRAAEPAADHPVLFRAGFDGTTTATLRDAPLKPVREANAAHAASDHSQALVLGAGAALEYDLGEGLPGPAGAIEVRFKPGFPQRPDQPARTIFSLTGAADARLNFEFMPQGTRWQFAATLPGWRRSVAAYYFNEANEKRWNHLVLTWDEKAANGPVVRFYRDGKWDRSRTEAYKRSFGGLRRLILGGTGDAQTSLDEIVIYNRALDEAAVAFLHRSIDQPDRFAALLEKEAVQARAARAESDARRALIARLQGKVAHLINPRGGQQRDFRLPGGIVATGLRVEDVGKADLSRFTVIYGPPGGGYQLNREQDEVLRQYVKNGGAYVGVCAGANYAGRAKLLNMSTHSLKNQGLVTIGVKPHPITQGFPGEVVIHHGNGPIMVPGEGCHVVGTFQVGQNFPLTTAAIVAGENGRGRVVAFGPHPTGGAVEFQSQGAHFRGEELGTDTLLVNALLWAARLLD